MKDLFAALELDPFFGVTGHGRFASRYCVSDLAVSSMGAVGCALADLIEALGLAPARPDVTVDQRLASLWFRWSLYPDGWKLPPVWDAIAGDYRSTDGWVRLHTNAMRHRQAACSALNVEADRAAVADIVLRMPKSEVEDVVVSAGGAAAAMHSREEWLAHPQGRAVSGEPMVDWSAPRHVRAGAWRPTLARPLAGLRVVDLTRVLAGPVATRTLAGFGAEVLRIDPPDWDEPSVVPDVTPGKRCARLDLRKADGRDRFAALLAEADVFVHGYRPGALDGLGLDEAWRRSAAPNVLEASLCAYGWTGPWSRRRGFDSLVQMSSGIAASGMAWAGKDTPTPLPVQALDHATGYIMAAAIIRALETRIRDRRIRDARLSLARTAELLASSEQDIQDDAIDGVEGGDLDPAIERTPWGAARRLASPLRVNGAIFGWDSPACELGSSPAQWG
ncbi:MAG: CoA transferase [Hyphomonadaceae bacterium]